MWLPFTRRLIGRLFHKVGPAQAKALRPKRSKFIRGTSRRSPLEDRRHRFGVRWFSSEARYTFVDCLVHEDQTSILNSMRFLTGASVAAAVLLSLTADRPGEFA